MHWRNTPGNPRHYRNRRKQILAAANATPTYRCPRCGLTLDEGIQQWGNNGRWEAGHITASQPFDPLQAEHAHCNRSAGGRLGNQRLWSGYGYP